MLAGLSSKARQLGCIIKLVHREARRRERNTKDRSILSGKYSGSDPPSSSGMVSRELAARWVGF